MPNSFDGRSNRRPDLSRLQLSFIDTSAPVSLGSSVAGGYLFCSGGAGTLTLPASMGVGQFFVIRNNNASALPISGLSGVSSIGANASLVVVATASGYNVL